MENGNQFLFQLTNQDPAYATLTTYTGSHAAGAGSGWFTTFSVNFCAIGFSIFKH